MLFEYFKNAFRWTVVLLADQKTYRFPVLVTERSSPVLQDLSFRDHSEMHDSLSIGPVI